MSAERFKQLQLDKNFEPLTLKEIEKIAPEFFSTKPVAKLSDGETIDKWLSSYYRNNAKNAYIGINKAEFKLSYEQFASIYHYTGSGYEKLNAYLNGVKEIDSETEVLFNSVKSLLNHSLEQLPKAREKRLYRWLNLSDELLEQYQVGKEIKLPAFTSTTYDKDKKIDLNSNSNVRLVIVHKTGKKIERLSQHTHEKEVLLPADTKHVVQSSKRKKKDGISYIEIELLEITE